jgi:ribonuclease HII
MKNNYKYIIGIDEAGRGPIAGPVSVGVTLFERNKYEKFKKGIARKDRSLSGNIAKRNDGRCATLKSNNLQDSKKLSEKKREEWFEIIKENKNIRYIVCFESARQIDKLGIANAIKNTISKVFKKLEVIPDKCKILLDGTLKAPKEFKNQKTIIKGDEKEPIISLASIVAKVSRDRKMKNFAKKYPEYNFEKHKGYGTKLHHKILKKYGFCNIHRKSFLKRFKN